MNDLINREDAIITRKTHACDLVSRQAAIDAFYMQSDDDGWWTGTAQDAEELLKGLQSADLSGYSDKLWKNAYERGKAEAMQWIPCSERLPELRDEKYLVSLAWGGVGTMEYKSTGFHNYGSFSPVPIETVTAWMPLPEPYKKEEE